MRTDFESNAQSVTVMPTAEIDFRKLDEGRASHSVRAAACASENGAQRTARRTFPETCFGSLSGSSRQVARRFRLQPRFKTILLTSAFALCAFAVSAAPKTKNVFLITTDGLRWQEVFAGAEQLLIDKTNGGVKNVEALTKKFWRETPEERRKALMPFLWSNVAVKGQIYGNRPKGSEARITNLRKFSYPGYNEFLTGAADPYITSNSKIPNRNTNVFEWLNTRPGFQGRVGAVVNWDVIPWILNAERSGLPVWTGYPLPPKARALIKVSPELEQLVADTTPIWDAIIMDSITFHAAMDYVKQEKPRAFYLAFGETDEWAHDGRYDCYLNAAHHVDRFIQRLWETVQAMPEYRDTTTFIISTDHGRGSGPRAWRDHGEKIEAAEYIWIAVMGPDTPALGERANCATVTQSQIAATVGAAVGQDFHAAFPKMAGPIREAFVGIDAAKAATPK